MNGKYEGESIREKWDIRIIPLWYNNVKRICKKSLKRREVMDLG